MTLLGALGILGVLGGMAAGFFWRHRRQVAQIAGQVLLQATEAGDVSQMQTLLDQGADLRVRNALGCTPLHVASAGGDLAVVTLLLHYGADVHARSNTGKTPLDHAMIYGGGQAVIQRLKEYGAQTDTDNDMLF